MRLSVFVLDEMEVLSLVTWDARKWRRLGNSKGMHSCDWRAKGKLQ